MTSSHLAWMLKVNRDSSATFMSGLFTQQEPQHRKYTVYIVTEKSSKPAGPQPGTSCCYPGNDLERALISSMYTASSPFQKSHMFNVKK